MAWGTLVLLAALGARCSQVPAPILSADSSDTVRVPVVFVPGVTGVELRDRSTGELVWGRGRNLLGPFDRGYRLARWLPAASAMPRLEPGRAILELRLFGIVRRPVYRSLVDLFEANGYRHGHLEDPRPGDGFFLFAYDWRQDNVTSACRLADQLRRLQRVRGGTRLRVILVCQSNGAHVCRYLTRYGGATLEDAESLGPQRLPGIEIDKLVLVGASNGGSLRVLRELDRGRRYLWGVGRRWAPETLFTFASLYQDLPVYTEDLFVDEKGASLAVDLFDAASWERFGWSAFGAAARRRLAAEDHREIFGREADRRAFLERSLNRAVRFHRVLHRDNDEPVPTSYYLITNRHNPTPARAVLLPEGTRWRTLFAGDRELRQLPVHTARVESIGDGHATLESQLWLSPQERARLASEPLEVAGEHFEMVLGAATFRHLLEIVAGTGPSPGGAAAAASGVRRRGR